MNALSNCRHYDNKISGKIILLTLLIYLKSLGLSTIYIKSVGETHENPTLEPESRATLLKIEQAPSLDDVILV